MSRFSTVVHLNYLRERCPLRPVATGMAGLLALAIALDGLGFLLVKGVPHFTVDTLMYLRMATDGHNSVPAPYSFRVLVPFLAAQMHVPIALGLKIIAAVSLPVSLWLAGLCALRTGVSVRSAAAGIIVLFCSRAFLYQFHNPYLTDAPGLAILMSMTLASLAGAPEIFGALGAAGMMVRESTAFMVPGILFSRQWRRGVVACVVCATVFVVPRLFGSGYSQYLQTGGLIHYNFSRPLTWIGLVALSWYMAWPLLPLGLALLPKKQFSLIAGTTVTLVLGCMASCIVAGDVERMCLVLSPVIAISAAHVFDHLFRRSQPMAWAALAVWIAQLFAMCPYIGRPGTHIIPALAFTLPALLVLFYTVLALRPAVVEGMKEKADAIRSSSRALMRETAVLTGRPE